MPCLPRISLQLVVLVTVLATSCIQGVCLATQCENLPTQFDGDEFPSGNFFSNFDNDCYTIRFAQGAGGTLSGDLNSTYDTMYFKVNPKYQLIILGTYPNARYFSITVYDEHKAYSQTITDTNIVPLTSQYVNPYKPGVEFVAGQKYAVPIGFGGTPGTLQTGCMMNGYNVDVNGLDGTQRHTGMDWNSDPSFQKAHPNYDVHVVDTAQHTNPNTAGFIMIRSYLDITTSSYQTNPHVIVRDVASGCAYPADYALNTLQIVTYESSTGGAWLNQSQIQDHQHYENVCLPQYCFGSDPQNQLSWSRGPVYVQGGNPDSSYIRASVPAQLPRTLASAQEVMRIRVRIPSSPPTPCAGGCSRSGSEQIRYMSLSFESPGGDTLASLADSAFTTDPKGYATLIVGTGALVPPWVTPANGYTYLNLRTISGYQNLNALSIRNILPAATFNCAGQIVPYRTGVFAPAGGLMGDYLPVVDYPMGATLPRSASPLIGPNACGIFPPGQPNVLPQCGVSTSPPAQIGSVVTQCPAAGCTGVAAQPQPPLTINGAGFGDFPNGLPYTGDSNYLELTDSTQGWDTGFGSDQCTVSIGEWSQNSISLVANINPSATCPLASGDQLVIKIWNPQSMGNPATFTVTAN